MSWFEAAAAVLIVFMATAGIWFASRPDPPAGRVLSVDEQRADLGRRTLEAIHEIDVLADDAHARIRATRRPRKAPRTADGPSGRHVAPRS